VCHQVSTELYFIVEIRKGVAKLQDSNWKIEFPWINAYAGNYGNELSDKLIKEAARSKHTEIAFARSPISALYYEIQLDSL